MQGKGLDQEGRDSPNRGLQPRVFDYLFGLINQSKREAQTDMEIEYVITCSYLEIYNEHIMDLLGDSKAVLNIREDIKKGVYVENLQEENALNSGEAISLLIKGASNRHVGATMMNFESSRSVFSAISFGHAAHCIVANAALFSIQFFFSILLSDFSTHLCPFFWLI